MRKNHYTANSCSYEGLVYTGRFNSDKGVYVIMNNEVWKRTAEFFVQLRCENIGRESYVKLLEYDQTLKNDQRERMNLKKFFQS